MLSGTFTGSKLTGVNLCIGAGMRDTLDMALSTLPGCGPHRAPGTILQIAQTSRTIDNALRIVMTSSPAIYIDESSVRQKPNASIPDPKDAKSKPTASTAPAGANAFQQIERKSKLLNLRT